MDRQWARECNGEVDPFDDILVCLLLKGVVRVKKQEFVYIGQNI